MVAISSLRVTDFIFPLRGDFLTNWLSNTSSFGASIVSCSCALSAASICCSEGSLTLSFSGAEIATVGLACINFAAIWLIVSTLMSGKVACTNSYSHCAPGMDSPSSKWRIHSWAKRMFLRVLRSLKYFSMAFSCSFFTRSNSALVNPYRRIFSTW